MVKVEPYYYPTVNAMPEGDEKPLNPNDLLMSMFSDLGGVEQTSNSIKEEVTAADQDPVQSFLRAFLVKSSATIASPQADGAIEASPLLQGKEGELPLPTPSLAALNPTLASALSGILSQQRNNFCNQLSKRKSGPVKLEGPVVPLHIQRHNEGKLDLPSNHKVSYNGQEATVPDEIRCHLCNHPMKMCYRKSKYKEEIREYPAYRCLRKGCQTFRAIRKILEPEENPQCPAKRKNEEGNDPMLRSLLSTPAQPEAISSSAVKMATSDGEEQKGTENGTLIFVPFSLTASQVTKFQEIAKSILLQDKLAEKDGQIPETVVVPTSFTEAQIKEKMLTEAGKQEIREELFQGIMRSKSKSSSPIP